MVIYDMMQFIKLDVLILCMGFVVSMGVFLFVLGVKGKCFVLLNLCVMIYQLLGGVCGQVFDIEIQVCEIFYLKEWLNNLFVQYMGQDVECIVCDIDCDNFMLSEDVKVYGLIDQVLLKCL